MTKTNLTIQLEAARRQAERLMAEAEDHGTPRWTRDELYDR